jgi:hypothetical protein
MTATTIKPWFNSTDTEERNIKAKKAYSGKYLKKFVIYEEKHVISPLMTPIVSEWLDFFSG